MTGTRSQVVIGNELHTRKMKVVFVSRADSLRPRTAVPRPEAGREHDLEDEDHDLEGESAAGIQEITAFREGWVALAPEEASAGVEIEEKIVRELVALHGQWIAAG